ncbi:hypothetical protein L1987_85791 [Smallanthus sonchifolius]|uniref:Uncharacterized protein n=1 Tax=Smallanthus sonchifolius TaxID=185202 RepID=A0ACB8Y1N8_9ASTR|nr:hypothetical protein L1987_85791 [Smallanthus sonchifolius]
MNGQELIGTCHYKVSVGMITTLHHPLGVIQATFLIEVMENWSISHLDGVIKMGIYNLICIQSPIYCFTHSISVVFSLIQGFANQGFAFGKKLKDRQIEEWKGYYINYKRMKKKVKQYARQHEAGGLEHRYVLWTSQ